MISALKREPVMVAAFAISVVLAVLITSGIITVEDVNDFVALVGALVPIVLGFIVRARVTPVSS